MKSLSRLLLLFTFAAFTTATFAQTTPEVGSLGIRSTIGGQSAIEVPYQLNEQLSIAPAITINTLDGGTNTIGIAIIPRYYMSTVESLSTYFKGNIGFRNNSFDAGGSVTDFTLGAGYGAEYFFGSNFSLSADANLGLRFGDSANNFFTLSTVSASVYF
jgi:hypothetical protein